jgi:hypothetical protein
MEEEGALLPLFQIREMCGLAYAARMQLACTSLLRCNKVDEHPDCKNELADYPPAKRMTIHWVHVLTS